MGSNGDPQRLVDHRRSSRAATFGHWSVGLAMAVVGTVLTGTPSQAGGLAACASGNPDAPGIIDAACCPGDVLGSYWPGRSPDLNQILCQLLVFPTHSTLNGTEFSQRIVDGSVSSDSRQASAESMTLPSLWWNRDSLTRHLGGPRLVQSWLSYQIADSSVTVVDVVINPQIWSVLTYNERFAVLNQFGTTARDFGYNLRFFQGNARSYRLVGLYACKFSSPPTDSSAGLVEVEACSANLDMTQIVQIQRHLLAEGDRRQQPIALPDSPLPNSPLVAETDR
jgi:hypothetical protein